MQFKDVVVLLRQFLEPILLAGKNSSHWNPKTGWLRPPYEL